ncbi:phospholipid-binding protein MlaC [Methylomonas sp. HYX-M1]|uniref:MlaC/ttg2D family ABC transporter substrate-binding protein n=1 Tax=Methylomonas sp. HYX-M1 TaxID=3139307 RepID=UPI00345B532C
MKTFLLAITLATAAVLTPAGTQAAVGGAADDPQAIVQSVSSRIQEHLQSAGAGQDFKQLSDYVASEIDPYIDFDLVSGLVLGSYWKTATPAERSEFSREFKTLLMRVYARGFAEAKNWSLKFFPSDADPSGQKTLIKTQILQAERKPIAVDYRMLQQRGSWKVYDILIDGVSLVATYRSSFRSEIETNGGSLTGTLDNLRKHNQQSSAAAGN